MKTLLLLPLRTPVREGQRWRCCSAGRRRGTAAAGAMYSCTMCARRSPGFACTTRKTFRRSSHTRYRPFVLGSCVLSCSHALIGSDSSHPTLDSPPVLCCPPPHSSTVLRASTVVRLESAPPPRALRCFCFCLLVRTPNAGPNGNAQPRSKMQEPYRTSSRTSHDAQR